MKIDKDQALSKIKQGIELSKATGMDQFYLGLKQAHEVIMEMKPTQEKDLDVKHMKITNEVVDRIAGYLEFPTREEKIRELIDPLVQELDRMRGGN